MKNNKILFIYISESKAGLSGKAAKIEQGFLGAGCTLGAIYLSSGGARFTRIAEILSVYARPAIKIIFGRYDIVFMGCSLAKRSMRYCGKWIWGKVALI